MKKRIGLFTRDMQSGGAQRAVSHLTEILADWYDVFLILFQDDVMEYEIHCPIISLHVPATIGAKKILLFPRRMKALKSVKKRYKLECVISFLDVPNMINLCTNVQGCHNIISIRNYSKLENMGTLVGHIRNFMLRHIYQKAEAIISVSKLLTHSLCLDYGLAIDRIFTVYNPYDAEKIRKQSNKILTGKNMEFMEHKFVCLSVGRIMPQKGTWHLVKAFSLFHKKNHDSCLVLVGEDYSNGQLKKLIDKLKLQDSILCTGRSRNPYQYMRCADIYILSSLFEGFPNALVEAMLCECAVIAADCKSGPREILYEKPDLSCTAESVEFADYGLLIPPMENEENWDGMVITKTEQNMATAMETIYAQSDIRKQLQKSAYKRARKFSNEECGIKYRKILEQILGEEND